MSGDTAPRRVYSVEEVDAMGAAPAPKPKVYTPEEVDALAAAPAPAPGTPPEPIDEEAQWRPGPRVHPANAALGSSPTPMVPDGAGGFRTETDREVNRRSTNPLRSGAQEYIDRVAGMQDLAAPMDESKRVAYDDRTGMAGAGLAGAAGGANTVMQAAFAPAAPILALPGVHQLAALGAIPGRIGRSIARGIPVQAGGRVEHVLPWDLGEGAGMAAEAGTNLAMLKAAPATEAAAMKAVGKSPVGTAVASAARYDQGAGPVGRAAAALTERMRGPQTAAPVAALPPAVAAPTVPAWKPPVAPPEGAIAPDALYKPPMRYEGTRAPAVDIQPIREVPRPAGSPGVAEFKAESVNRVLRHPEEGQVPTVRDPSGVPKVAAFEVQPAEIGIRRPPAPEPPPEPAEPVAPPPPPDYGARAEAARAAAAEGGGPVVVPRRRIGRPAPEPIPEEAPPSASDYADRVALAKAADAAAGSGGKPTPVRRIGRTPPPVERPASPEPATIEPVKETVPQGAAEQPRQAPEVGKVPAEVVAPQEAPKASKASTEPDVPEDVARDIADQMRVAEGIDVEVQREGIRRARGENSLDMDDFNAKNEPRAAAARKRIEDYKARAAGMGLPWEDVEAAVRKHATEKMGLDETLRNKQEQHWVKVKADEQARRADSMRRTEELSKRLNDDLAAKNAEKAAQEKAKADAETARRDAESAERAKKDAERHEALVSEVAAKIKDAGAEAWRAAKTNAERRAAEPHKTSKIAQIEPPVQAKPASLEQPKAAEPGVQAEPSVDAHFEAGRKAEAAEMSRLGLDREMIRRVEKGVGSQADMDAVIEAARKVFGVEPPIDMVRGGAENRAWASGTALGTHDASLSAHFWKIRREASEAAPPPAPAAINKPSTSPEPAPAETPFERRMREAEEGREGGGETTKEGGGLYLGSGLGGLGTAGPTKAIGALDKAWDLTVGRAVDAVSERVKKSAPFVRRVRQAFVNEELTLDPSEQLHQTKQRLGKGGGAVKYEARLAEKLAKSIDKELRRVPEADAAEGYKYLGGETDTLPATITPKAKQALDAASAAMHVRRVAMQARGIISEAVLKEYPRFVSRIMRLKENGQRIIGGSGTVSKIAREVHRMDAPGVLLDHGEQAVADLVAKLGTKTRVVTGTKSRTLVKFDTPEARDAFIEAARKEFGHRRGSTGWRDSFDALSETDRAMLHEITDPADSFAITMARANAKIAAHDFLGELQKIGGGKAANGGDWVVDLAKGEKPPPGYTKVEGHQWGPLNGKALSPDIHEYATSLTVKPPISAIGEVFREGFRSWKIARTIESWPTVVRNWLSHDYMTTQAGVSLMNPENWEFHAKAIKALAGHDEATLKWAVENGIVGNDWYATLNKERIGNALSGSETPVKTLYRWFTESPEGDDLARSHDLNVAAARALGDAIPRPDTLVPGMKTVRKAASHLYSAQEDLVRLPAALKLQKAGKSIHAIMEELEATTPSYHRHGAAQTYLANTPIIGPFARFTWEQSRILANNLRRHPSRAVIALYYSYLSKKAIEAAFSGDVTDEEKAAIESEFGWQAAATGRDEKGRPKVLDLRWTNPVGQLLAGPETEKYDSASKAWINYAATVLGGGVSPMIDPIVGTATGNDTRGRPVADEVTKAKYGAAGAVGEVYRRYIGRPVFGRHLDALRAAKAGVGVTPRSPVLTEEDVVRGYLLGLSMGRLDISKAEENIGDLMDAKKAAWTKTLKGRARAGATDAELDEMIKLAETDEAARAESLGKRLDTLDAARRSRPEEP